MAQAGIRRNKYSVRLISKRNFLNLLMILITIYFQSNDLFSSIAVDFTATSTFIYLFITIELSANKPANVKFKVNYFDSTNMENTKHLPLCIATQYNCDAFIYWQLYISGNVFTGFSSFLWEFSQFLESKCLLAQHR